MEDNHVVDPQVMYMAVLLHISHNMLERARGILSLTNTSLRGAEEQTSGATHIQHPGPVYPHPVGCNKKKWHGSKGRGGGHPRGGQGSSRGGGQGQKSLCDKHEKFGKYAHYCSSPKTCSLPENK